MALLVIQITTMIIILPNIHKQGGSIITVLAAVLNSLPIKRLLIKLFIHIGGLLLQAGTGVIFDFIYRLKNQPDLAIHSTGGIVTKTGQALFIPAGDKLHSRQVQVIVM